MNWIELLDKGEVILINLDNVTMVRAGQEGCMIFFNDDGEEALKLPYTVLEIKKSILVMLKDML